MNVERSNCVDFLPSLPEQCKNNYRYLLFLLTYRKSIHKSIIDGAMDMIMGLVIMNKYGSMDTIVLTKTITVLVMDYDHAITELGAW